MNEVLRAIAERNSCRDYTGEPLTKDEITALVEAALAAPSAVNRQPWHIIMCTDKKLIEEMDDDAVAILAADEDQSTYERIKSRGGKVFYNAPAVMVVCGDGTEWDVIDSGILIENVALAAHSLGLGNVICAMFRIPLEGTKGAEFKKRLKFPDGHRFTMSILIGKAKSGKQPHELDRSKVTYI